MHMFVVNTYWVWQYMYTCVQVIMYSVCTFNHLFSSARSVSWVGCKGPMGGPGHLTYSVHSTTQIMQWVSHVSRWKVDTCLSVFDWIIESAQSSHWHADMAMHCMWTILHVRPVTGHGYNGQLTFYFSLHVLEMECMPILVYILYILHTHIVTNMFSFQLLPCKLCTYYIKILSTRVLNHKEIKRAGRT